LTATSLPLDIALDATFVHGYVTLGSSPLIDVAPLLSPSYAWAAGGIVSNARDVTTRQAVVMVNVDETYVSWTRIHAFAERALCRG